MNKMMIMGLALTCVSPLLKLQAKAQLPNHVKQVETYGEVFGDGAKATKVVIEYDEPIVARSLKVGTYLIEGKKIKRQYVSSSVKGNENKDGTFVFLELEAATDLSDKPMRKPLTAEQEAERKERDKQMGGPGLKAGWSTGGDDQHGDSVSLRQVLAIKTKNGKKYDAMQTTYKTAVQHYAVVDDFIQKIFKSPFTGQSLPYNLFLPKDYDPQKKYPLVLFIHDAGVASSAVNTPLLQGRGAVTWATADFQAKHPCIVVAPEFPVVTVDDNWNYSHHLDATIALVKNLSQEYAVDTSRIYTTGQSMGCMSSMVLLLKEPNLFAGALLVAGK